jgi:hypothetical protein
MSSSMDDSGLLDEQIWRVWEYKRKLREEKAARKIKIAAAIILVLLAIGGAFYLLAMK